jgi:hypothetical protein
MPGSPNDKNEIVVLSALDRVLAHWSLFKAGFLAVAPQASRGDVTEEQFMMMILDIVRRGVQYGVAVILTSPEGEELGYGVAVDTTEPFSKCRTATVYMVYSNKKCSTTTKELLAFGENWARQYGFNKLFACSRRFNSASQRLFEDVWGFTRSSIVYEKDIQ